MRDDGSDPTNDPPLADPLPIVRLLTICYFVMLAVGSSIALYQGSLPERIVGVAPARDVLLGAGAGAGLVLVSWLMAVAVKPLREIILELQTIFKDLSPSRVVLLAVLVGCAEEILFRGVLQPALGLVATSLIFGLIHIFPTLRLFPWTLFAIGAGFLLGWLYESTGGLLAPTVAHILVNGTNLLLISRRPGRRLTRS